MEISSWMINLFDETNVEVVVIQEEVLEFSTNEEPKGEIRKKNVKCFGCRQEYPKNILDCEELQ